MSSAMRPALETVPAGSKTNRLSLIFRAAKSPWAISAHVHAMLRNSCTRIANTRRSVTRHTAVCDDKLQNSLFSDLTINDTCRYIII